MQTPLTSLIARAKQRGFTLLELLVGLIIAGILAAMAVPSFGNMLHDQRVANESNRLIGALNLARAEAAKRRRTMSLCPSTNGTACTGGSSWEDGYLLFTNLDADSPPVVDAVEAVVRIFEAAPDNISLRADTFELFISYAANTFSNTAGTFTICDHRGAADARGILINGVGRARISQDSDSDGKHEDRNGNDLACP